MNGSGPKIRLKSPLAPQPVPQKLASMPPSKGPFSANMHPITLKLSVPIPEGMCFRKMVGGPLRKWTDRGQKSTSNHHKDSSRLLTTRLKLTFQMSFLHEYASDHSQLCSYTHSKVGNDQMHIRGEMTSGKLTLSGFVRSRLESLWWFEVDFWPDPFIFEGGPHHFPKAHALRYGHRKFESDWMYIRENGPLEGGIEASFWGTGWGAKGDFRRIFGPDPSFSKGLPHHFPKAHALRYGHRKFESDWMYIRGEWALIRWHWIKFLGYRLGC